MYYTLSRPPDGRAILLDLDRDVPAGHTAHPIGRAAESAVHALFALLGILRSCGNDDDPFARHNDRSLRKTDSAFVLSGLPASAIARHDERGRLVDLTFPIREAALLLRRREGAGER